MTMMLILEIGQKVILEDFPLMTFISELLGTSAISAHHTAVAHINFQQNKVVKYYWAKPEIRPWEHPLPAQCPQCLSLRPWDDVKTIGNKLTFRCKGVNSSGECCSAIASFLPPSEYEHLTA
jgi:hypothetical protein